MHIQELKERVARADYAVDADAVAAAIMRRWRVAHVTAAPAPRHEQQRHQSREVVKSR